MATPLRVLIVEDSEDDAVILLHELKRGDFDITAKRVDSQATMEAALDSEEWDLIISDYSLPQFGGKEALKIYQSRRLEIPFISVSGAMGEEIAVEMMRAGVHDYVMKSNFTRLNPAVERELRAAGERRCRRQLEEARALLASIVECCDAAIVGKTLQGIIRTWNAAAESLYGYSAAEVIGKSISILVPPDRSFELTQIFDKIRAGERIDRFETVRRRKDGTLVDVSLTISPMRDDGRIVGASSVAHDITRVKEEERERIKLIRDLSDALADVKTLSGLLPMCASCKKIRDDTGYWQQVETYIKQHSNADFTHGICPECVQRLYPDVSISSEVTQRPTV
jgi:two-component system cell cycle sensor histidine kinase/response regulator CckA